MKIAFWLSTPRLFCVDDVDEKPFGGAEMSALNLAKELSIDYNVCMFGNLQGPDGEKNGIKFLNYNDLKYNEMDILVVVRADQRVLDPRYSANFFGKKPKKIWLWTGDESSQPNNDLFHDTWTLKEIDKILVKSQWQKNDLMQAFPLIMNDKIKVMYNGVSTKSSTDLLCQHPRFLYASTAYRGLHMFLDIWPKIRDEIPNAELDCYAKTTLYMPENPRDNEFKELYKKLDDLPGLTIKEPISQSKLFDIMGDYYAMLYPNCLFNESSCGVALEAMAHGLPVIASNRAGLSETLDMGFGYKIFADPIKAKNGYINEFVATVKSTWYNKENTRERSFKGKERINKNYTWKRVSERWKKMIGNHQELWSESPQDLKSTVSLQ